MLRGPGSFQGVQRSLQLQRRRSGHLHPVAHPPRRREGTARQPRVHRAHRRGRLHLHHPVRRDPRRVRRGARGVRHVDSVPVQRAGPPGRVLLRQGSARSAAPRAADDPVDRDRHQPAPPLRAPGAGERAGDGDEELRENAAGVGVRGRPPAPPPAPSAPPAPPTPAPAPPRTPAMPRFSAPIAAPAPPAAAPRAAPPPAPRAAPPPAAPAMRPAAPPAAPAAPAGPGQRMTSPLRPVNPFMVQDPKQKARRLARALVSDLVVYHPEKRQQGLRDGTLPQLFKDEIEKSWREYVDQVGAELAKATSFWAEALNEILAGGNKVF